MDLQFNLSFFFGLVFFRFRVGRACVRVLQTFGLCRLPTRRAFPSVYSLSVPFLVRSFFFKKKGCSAKRETPALTHDGTRLCVPSDCMPLASRDGTLRHAAASVQAVVSPH